MYYIVHNKHSKASRDFVEEFGVGNMVVDYYEPSDPLTIMFHSTGISISDFPSVVDVQRKLVSTCPASYEAACTEIEGLNLVTIKRTRANQINVRTKDLLYTGIVFDSKRLSLLIENQSTINLLFSQKDSLTYPVQIKGFDEYIDLANSSELASLFNQASLFVIDTLNNGYTLKQSLDGMTHEQLLSFVDVR